MMASSVEAAKEMPKPTNVCFYMFSDVHVCQRRAR